MRSTNQLLSAAAIVGLAAASPAPQQLDFAQLAAAPAVQTAPVLNGVSNQTVTISSAAIAASISAAVSTTATAIATGAPAKRDLEKRTFGYPFAVSFWCSWFGTGCPADYYTWGQTTSSSAAVKTSSTAASSSSVATNVNVKTSSSSSSSSSSSAVKASSSSAAAASTTSSSSTLESSSGTSTTSSTTACPTTPEDGTYCGFINPEDPCAPQPDGYGPKVTPDTTDAFLGYAPFHSMATAAPTVVPRNNSLSNAYQQTFRDLNASSSANSYMGLHTLTSYDVAGCAALCDQTLLCTSFNIFIERDPSLNPCRNDSTDPTVWGYWCPMPSSITNFKCTLWGSNLDASSATNQGGWRKDFPVVITASNGYDATNFTFPPDVVDTVDNTTSVVSSAVNVATSAVVPVVTSALSSVTGAVAKPSSSSIKSSSTSSSAAAAPTTSKQPCWSKPTNCNKKAMNAPNYWMGSKFFPGPYNVQLCGDYASYQHAVNKKAAIAAGKSTFTPCNSFNAYYIHKNGVGHGTYCALYDTTIPVSYATYTGGWSGNDRFDCKQSYHFTRNVQDSGRC